MKVLWLVTLFLPILLYLVQNFVCLHISNSQGLVLWLSRLFQHHFFTKWYNE
uniref:Uncharacterized protein n=1 Tax=Rhizophora mucronata TaxID=61149 RepID=A0A2P2IMI8_RHIMU